MSVVLLLLAACSKPSDTEDSTPPPRPTFEECFPDMQGDGTDPTPDYDQFHPVLGHHCRGTDHQDIHGVQRVVFLGDSITVGTPPTPSEQYYRAVLAHRLADQFGLEPPAEDWEKVDVNTGQSRVRESGAFASCAKWGARADDLIRDNTQIEDCFPESTRDLTTLVVMTMGGNDLQSITEGFLAGKSTDQLWTQTHDTMDLMRGAVEWLVEPGRFPNGVYVIDTNLYEFTDATGDVTSCPTASAIGYDAPITDPALAQMVVWSMEQYMSIAVDTHTDMLFLLETFCGHGYHRDDPTSRCYQGPDAELWFDFTCIHPNPVGHEVIADMFEAVVEE